MQKQIENYDEHKKPVYTSYIGNEDIRMSLKNLKAELHQARLNTVNAISDGFEETIEAKQVETSGDTDEIIVLEHQEQEQSMDC